MTKRTSWGWAVLGAILASCVLVLGPPLLAQNSAGGAFLTQFNYIVSGQWTWRGRVAPWVIEGATEDNFETTITFDEPTADTTLTFPDGGGASAAFLVSALTTNDVDVVNSVWGVSNGFRFEGATANAFELTLAPADVTADVTLTLPLSAGADAAVMVSTLTSNSVDVVNSVWGVSNGLTFEGATADAGELFLTVANIATASRTMTLPDMGAASAVVASSLTTNTLGAANSVWGVSNGLTFEGLTADAGELFLTVSDIATASRTMTLPDMGAASAVIASTLTTNTVNVANSIWGISNALAFGGATGADGFEIQLTPADVGADRVVTIPDMAAASALLATTLTTNAPEAANSVWGVSGGLVFEGSGADTEELTMNIANVTADITITWANDLVGTYRPMTNIAADVTGGVFIMPPFGIAATDNDMTMADNTMYVYRVYVPQWITVANIYAKGTQGAQIAGGDDILGVAIFEDADAGVDLASTLSADFTATADVIFNVTDVTLGPGMYRIGVCSGDADGVAFVAGDPLDDEAIDVYNAGAVTIGTAANACVAGDPPTTTGALTTADILMPVLKLGP